MNRETELALIDEILDLKAAKSAFLDDQVGRNPVENYLSDERFKAEKASIFLTQPFAAAHVSELASPGDFITRDLFGLPVLITRDKAGNVQAYLNVCRHRGTRLVDDSKGCKHRFSCPYHAWTYGSDGRLIGAPHFDEGFPEHEKAKLGLRTLPTVEEAGFVWVTPNAGLHPKAGFLAGLEEDMTELGLADMRIAARETSIRKVNWKTLVEGGIEAYHFRVAHRTTIGPHFEDNLSTYQCFGPHMRSVLPRTSMKTLRDQPRDSWSIRDHANVLYSFFPTNQLLVLQDHIAWISSIPLSPHETEVTITSLVPTSGPDAEGKSDEHWVQNHAITTTTLDEDFVIGESIHAVAHAGANDHMTFGRFEGALTSFNKTVERFL